MFSLNDMISTVSVLIDVEKQKKALLIGEVRSQKYTWPIFATLSFAQVSIEVKKHSPIRTSLGT